MEVNHTFAYLEGLYAIINEKQVRAFRWMLGIGTQALWCIDLCCSSTWLRRMCLKYFENKAIALYDIVCCLHWHSYPSGAT